MHFDANASPSEPLDIATSNVVRAQITCRGYLETFRVIFTDIV